MHDLIETDRKKEQAVLIGIINQSQDEKKVDEYLNELAFLSYTAGIDTVARFTQRLDNPHPRTFVGSGKIEEIRHFIETYETDLVIFDDELTPSQLRNIEKIFNRKILDRTNLILDIFAKRAKTAHAKVQVELAMYQYLLPRLTGMWTHLERQRGGTLTRGGSGEKEIETDRRIVRDKIARLKEQLKKIEKQKAIQRKNRGKLVRVALVGYTNVGKSTLMNLLCKSDVFAEDKLFATLDTTVRKMIIGNLPFLLSDTVGFIRKLPHHLVESFKSTLDEVRESDILLHIVDISHPNFEEQIEVVKNTLNDIGVNNKPSYIIFNKTDAYHYIRKDDYDLTPVTKANLSLEDLKKSWMAADNAPCLFISAKEKHNIDRLKELIYSEARKIHIQRFPYDDFLY